MADISDYLNSITASKEQIRQAIQGKHIYVPETTPFSKYADKIKQIDTLSTDEPGDGRFSWLTFTGKAAENLSTHQQVAGIKAGHWEDYIEKLPVDNMLISGSVRSIAISHNGLYLAIGVGLAPYLMLFKRINGEYIKLPNPDNLPTGIIKALTFSPDDKFLMMVQNTTIGYRRDGDTFTRIADIGATNFSSLDLAFHPFEKLLVTPSYSSGTLSLVYSYTDDGIFTRVGDFSGITTIQTVAFSPEGDILVCGAASFPYYLFFKYANGTFTKLTIESDPTSGVYKILFSPDGKYLFIAGSTEQRVYSRTGDTFTPFDGFPMQTTNVTNMAMSSDGAFLALSRSASPYLLMFKVNDGILDIINFNSGPNRGDTLCFSPSSDHLFVGLTTASPYLNIYTTFNNNAIFPSTLTNAMKYAVHRSAFVGIGFTQSAVNKGETVTADMIVLE